MSNKFYFPLMFREIPGLILFDKPVVTALWFAETEGKLTMEQIPFESGTCF